MARKSASLSAARAAPAHPQSRCRLFLLPAELRTTVWEMVLYVSANDDNSIKLSCNRFVANIPTVLNLLSTCRLINREAAPIFYNLHKLHICDILLLPNTWLRHYIPEHRPAMLAALSQPRLMGIKSICVESFFMEAITAMCKDLRKLPRLRNIEFQLVYLTTAEILKREMPFLKKGVAKLTSLKAIALCPAWERRTQWKVSEQDKIIFLDAQEELRKVVVVNGA